MMWTHLLVAVLCVAAFAALALAMERHQDDLFGAPLAPGRTRGLRAAGWGLLLLALAVVVRSQGWALGLVAYAGHTSFGAAAVFIALIAADRR